MSDEVIPGIAGPPGPPVPLGPPQLSERRGPDPADGEAPRAGASGKESDPAAGNLNLPRNLLVLSVFVAFALLFSCNRLPDERRDVSLATFPSRIRGAERIRVVIKRYHNVGSVRLSVDGEFQMLTASRPGGRLVKGRKAYRGLRGTNVNVSGRSVRIGRETVAPVVWIIPKERNTVRVGGERLPYGVSFFARGRNTMAVSMVLNLEEYLCGVLTAEVPVHEWRDEALKAQAVASRTYALYKILTRRGAPYDVDTTIMTMAYRRGGRHTVTVNRAVNATRGLVMAWKGKIFPAKFCSSCGGHTEDAEGVFFSSRVPPLSAVKCPYCDIKQNPLRASKGWSFVVSEGKVRDAVKALVRESKVKARVGEIQGIRIVRRGPDRRAVQFRIDHSYEPPLLVQANEFRLKIGAGIKEMCSTMLDGDGEKKDRIRKVRGGFLFRGRGWGHGVGMCQFGSQGMAMRGYAYHDILRHYYGAAVELRRLDYAGGGGGSADPADRADIGPDAD